MAFRGVALPPLTCSAACPGFRRGAVLAGGRWGPCGCGDRVRAGQAAVAGGPQAASNRFIHSVSRCQPSGRCTVMWPRPWRAIRAATLMRWPRMVAPRAFAWKALAKQPTARVRLWQMAARVSQAAFAGKRLSVILSCQDDHGSDLGLCDPDSVGDAGAMMACRHGLVISGVDAFGVSRRAVRVPRMSLARCSPRARARASRSGWLSAGAGKLRRRAGGRGPAGMMARPCAAD